MWTELQLDRGRVTLTALNRGAAEGDVSLGFETPDLGVYAASVLPTDGMVVVTSSPRTTSRCGSSAATARTSSSTSDSPAHHCPSRHQALMGADIAHDVIDETHGRTLQVPLPGGGDRTLWIAEEDEDPVGVIRH
jgi:hypothetical protein